MASY
jgi:hypothetical protein